jgi:hypothetical protein
MENANRFPGERRRSVSPQARRTWPCSSIATVTKSPPESAPARAPSRPRGRLIGRAHSEPPPKADVAILWETVRARGRPPGRGGQSTVGTAPRPCRKGWTTTTEASVAKERSLTSGPGRGRRGHVRAAAYIPFASLQAGVQTGFVLVCRPNKQGCKCMHCMPFACRPLFGGRVVMTPPPRSRARRPGGAAAARRRPRRRGSGRAAARSPAGLPRARNHRFGAVRRPARPYKSATQKPIHCGGTLRGRSQGLRAPGGPGPPRPSRWPSAA